MSYPKRVDKHIDQFAEHVFVWYDEAGLVGGAADSLAEAQHALHRYGAALDFKGLLPCPFCGSDAAKATRAATKYMLSDKKLSCSNSGCGAHFSYWHPDEWNRRATVEVFAARLPGNCIGGV